MKMTRIAAVLSVLFVVALGAAGAVLACEYESPASSAMRNATPVPKVAFKQAVKPVVAPVSKQAATPATKPVIVAGDCDTPPCGAPQPTPAPGWMEGAATGVGSGTATTGRLSKAVRARSDAGPIGDGAIFRSIAYRLAYAVVGQRVSPPSGREAV